MVFVYARIFVAARKRARRNLNKKKSHIQFVPSVTAGGNIGTVSEPSIAPGNSRTSNNVSSPTPRIDVEDMDEDESSSSVRNKYDTKLELSSEQKSELSSKSGSSIIGANSKKLTKISVIETVEVNPLHHHPHPDCLPSSSPHPHHHDENMMPEIIVETSVRKPRDDSDMEIVVSKSVTFSDERKKEKNSSKKEREGNVFSFPDTSRTETRTSTFTPSSTGSNFDDDGIISIAQTIPGDKNGRSKSTISKSGKEKEEKAKKKRERRKEGEEKEDRTNLMGRGNVNNNNGTSCDNGHVRERREEEREVEEERRKIRRKELDGNNVCQEEEEEGIEERDMNDRRKESSLLSPSSSSSSSQVVVLGRRRNDE